MKRLEGKIAIITGASKGLGEADARLFVKEGATTILTDVDTRAGEQLAKELGSKAEFYEQDVRDEEAWKKLISYVLERHDGLDVLVNNAGVVKTGSIEEQTLEDYELNMAVSARGTFLGCKHAVTAMKNSGGGSIINMSSITSMQGYAEIAAYSAAKGAIQSLTLSVAAYGAENQLGIRCNSLHPSSMLTPMVKAARALITDPEEAKRRLPPAAEMGEPTDVANMVVFLASDESKFINGTATAIDNGKSIIPGVFAD